MPPLARHPDRVMTAHSSWIAVAVLGGPGVGAHSDTAERAYFAVDTSRGEHPARPTGLGSGSMLQLLRAKPEDVVDVFVYVVVLNLAIEYLPSVLSESFTLSLLTAVLLKLSLEVVLVIKTRAAARVSGATTVPAKLAAALLLWATAAGSKIVVLELVNLIFGEAVSLGGFVSVTLLVLSLLLARGAVRGLLSLGHDTTSHPAEPDTTTSP